MSMIYISLEAPYEWVHAEGTRIEAFGEVPGLGDYPISGEETVVGVVPGEWVTSHLVTLPAKTRKQFNAAVPYALEELFAQDIEEVHFVCPKWQADSQITVYSVAKSKLQEWANLAKTYSIPATRIIPDYALLPQHDVAECSLAVSGDRALAQSKDGFGVTMDLDFVNLWLKETPLSAVIAVNNKDFAERLIKDNSERDIRHWSFGDRMAHWLEYSGQADIDLWTDQTRPRSRKSLFVEYWQAAALIGITITVLATSEIHTYLSLHREIKLITQESQELVKRLVPELDYVTEGQERTYAEKILSRQSQGASPSSLPRMLVALTPVLRSENILLKEVVYERSELTISGYISNLGQVDSVVKKLESLPSYTAKLQGTSNEGDTIVATFVVASEQNTMEVE